MPIPSAAHLPKSTGKFQDFGVSKLPEFCGPEILQSADRLKGLNQNKALKLSLSGYEAPWRD